ncbi:hypothetical protein BDR04DRAFT_1122244, partial [Suillus decipiens]
MNVFHSKRRQAKASGDTSPDAISLPGSISPPDTGIDISSTDYARRRRELMRMMSDLKSMGAEALIDLPSVVVIGGQSGLWSPALATKAILNPIFQREKAHSSKPLVGNGRDLQKTTTVPFGRTITDRNEVEVWLRRAQSAILNPNVPSSSFHTKTIEELRSTRNGLKFSRNVVCVSIEDPDATDLSFYDLPGLIQNEEAETVALVKSLAEHYTKKENTIILTTIPMS